MPNVVAIDLFCGAGGVTYGLERVGIDVVVGVDMDLECRYPYETNTDAQFLHRDIVGVLGGDTSSETPDLNSAELGELLPEDAITVIAGCAPCQPFSLINNGAPNESHEKWNLLAAMRQIVEELRPDIVAMENVAPLRSDEIYADNFRAWFEDDPEYQVWDNVVDCKDYLVPQTRKRLIMLASRFGDLKLVRPPAAEDPVTVRRAFAEVDPPELSAGEWRPDFHSLHKAAGLRSTNQKRMRHTAEGEDWHDLPDELKPPSEADSSYSAYGRMWWDEPAPTLTTKFFNWGSGRFGHPGYDEDESKSVDRAISFFEGGILQSFPPDYEFVPDGQRPTHNEMGRLIGNAVPVMLATAIGGSIRRHLDHLGVDATFVEKHTNGGEPGADYGELVGPPTTKELIDVEPSDESDSDRAPTIGQPVS